jgi:sugar O-acyltransferase (sialic acid O-acetyltransferase NeuD family)
MIIIGAKGYAKELLELFRDRGETKDLAFFDDVSTDINGLLFGEFLLLKNKNQVSQFFQKGDRRFTLGVGNPHARYKLAKMFLEISGEMFVLISEKAAVGHFENHIAIGTNIMQGSVITNGITISEGVLVNLNCTIGHDSYIGKYCELSPGVHISGHVSVGDFTSIGTGAVVLPGVSIGRNCIIGAGAVVNKNISDNSVAVGIPAKIVKETEPFDE